jgi:hypothetical protein
MDHWKITESEGSIVITCFGHDKAGTWPAAVVQFGAQITRCRQEVRVIADVREMTGYETGARRAWQEAFRRHRHLMQGVVFIGARSRGIRMGAAVVAAVAGVPVRFVDGWAEVATLRF